jgi:lauroyl/myristoyl acyltransferase
VRRWIQDHPLERAFEQEVVDEVARCWDGVPLPKALDALLDDARTQLLEDLLDARAAACDGPELAGRHLQIASLLPIEQLLKDDGSALLLTPSYGNWTAIAPALARRGYRVGVLDLRPRDRRPEHRLPAAPGLDLRQLPSEGYAGPLVRFAMEPGTVTVALADEGCGPRWANGALFGRQVRVGSTPFELARRAQLGVLPAFAVREHGLPRLLFEKPLRINDSDNPDHDLDVNASRWLKLLERNTRRFPEHYLAQLITRRRARATDAVPLFVEA